jgi:hypothetical protein
MTKIFETHTIERIDHNGKKYIIRDVYCPFDLVHTPYFSENTKSWKIIRNSDNVVLAQTKE